MALFLDIEADIYYKTLCSTGLAFIEKQHGQIEQKRNNLIDNKQKLVYSNYDSFIKFSEFSKELINDVSDCFFLRNSNFDQSFNF